METLYLLENLRLLWKCHSPSEVIVADQLEALINMDVISLDSTLDIVGTLCKKSRTFASFIETFQERYATIQYMIGVYRMSSE